MAWNSTFLACAPIPNPQKSGIESGRILCICHTAAFMLQPQKKDATDVHLFISGLLVFDFCSAWEPYFCVSRCGSCYA